MSENRAGKELNSNKEQTYNMAFSTQMQQLRMPLSLMEPKAREVFLISQNKKGAQMKHSGWLTVPGCFYVSSE